MIRRWCALFVCAACLLTLAAQPASASAPHGDFPLGQTASGAVCTAVQDPNDDAAQLRDARAWAIHCLGFDAVFGHVYAYGRDGADAVAAGGLWQRALAGRADCPPLQSANIPDLAGAPAATCKPRRGSVPYLAYAAIDGDGAAAAEGFAPIQPLLPLAVNIVLGRAPIPASSVQQAGAATNTKYASLADAAEAAQGSGDDLNARAQLENKGWDFANAERDFRELEASNQLSGHDRLVAEFNVALNISNQGGPDKFREADRLFAALMAKVAALHDRDIDALAYNYQALHLLNERRFAEADGAAKQAMAERPLLDPREEIAAGPESATLDKDNASIVISPRLAADLNAGRRIVGFRAVELTPFERREIQNAQAELVIGVARTRLGDLTAAREAIGNVEHVLSSGRLAGARSTAWLHSEVYVALANLDLRSGNPAGAARNFLNAVAIYDRVPDLSGSPREGDLYLNLAHAEAISGQGEKAAGDYERGIDLFQNGLQALGQARNLTGPYFDLLLARIAKDPGHAGADEEKFFAAMQVLTGQVTAKIFAEFAAGVSRGDPRSEQLARDLKEKNREIQLKRDAIRLQEDMGSYRPERKAADDAQLAAMTADATALQEQLLDANPRYGQVVEAAATLAGMQKALAAGEIYVKTVLLAERGYAIAITRDAVSAYPIALKKADAEAVVNTLRKPFDSPGSDFDVAQSHALFAQLFGPVQQQVRGARHLIYDPDSAMVSLPAAVFVTDDASAVKFAAARQAAKQSRNPRADLYRDIAWLARTTDISLSISSEMFLQSRAIAPSKGARAFVAFGNPVSKGPDPRRFALLTDPKTVSDPGRCEALRALVAEQGFRPLPEIEPAIAAIGRKYNAGPSDIVLGQAFSDDAIAARADLAQYRVVFFGTHGVLPGKMPCLPMPALVTSLGHSASSTGFLDAAKIVKLTLDADLVVLAACDTGSATTQAGETGLSASGDAFDGFVRDFIFAGARTLVVSQWEVRVQQTAALMDGMFAANAGSEAGALRAAQLALMNDGDYSHPFYWAGFTLVGDGARPMPQPLAKLSAR